MNNTGITKIALLIIAALFFSGCTSPAPSPAPSAINTEFEHLMLSPGDLSSGWVRAGNGPIENSSVTNSMKKLGWQRGHRALYADAIPMTDKSKVIVQDIMLFSKEANLSAVLDDHRISFDAIKSNDITVLPLPDPDLGERSFAVKITKSEKTGDTNYYVIGFTRSGRYEIVSMEGTPATFPAFLTVAERAAEKAR